ncbi:MAG: helix-turn-helix domain-containing protein [Pseudomonadota bacterium]
MDVQDWHIILAGIVTGAISVTAASILRSGASLAIKITGAGFCAGVIAYAIESFAAGNFFVFLISCQTLGFLWPFVALIFGISVSRWLLVLPGALMLISFLLRYFAPGDVQAACSFLQNMIEAGIGGLVLYAVWRSEDDDLDQQRRAVRRPFMTIIGIYVIGLAAFDFIADEQAAKRPPMLIDEVLTAALSVAGGLIFTSPRPGLLVAPRKKPEPEPAPKAAALDPEAQLLMALDKEMTGNQAWREEGLTVGGLADRLGVPEHRLRPVINQQLGYRNFATFINSHRLAEVKRRLTDPAHEKETIASIAYECGFGSLGPFGRAFKTETGMTPTAFRNIAKRSKNESAPVLKIATSQDEPTRQAG